ncbi:MAG: hypothetical protein DRG24_03325 [Epsilonproteobacteria bacterium]|nr:MAG: hypothetical protein DRG24_03325 [Campylobacterota bacterium]
MKLPFNYLLYPLKARRFYRLFLILMLIFVGYHAIVWYFFTSKLLDVHHPHHIGDLARIGYQYDSAHYRLAERTLPRHYINGADYDGKPVDILTVGDSFSNGGGGGANPYYQDFLATGCQCRVLNLQQLFDDVTYIETVIAWINSGYLNILRPKIILIESIARSSFGRFSVAQNWELNASLKLIQDKTAFSDWGEGVVLAATPPIINTANYKYPLYNLYYQFSPTAFDKSHTYKLPLKEELFSVKAGSTLLFYDQDATGIHLITQAYVTKMNDNLNRLALLLKPLGIALYVMPAVDKYDLYQPFLSSDLFAKNPLFEFWRPLRKEYIFVDTKAILSRALQSGVKDVFFADDTHWSPVASDAVVKAILPKIKDDLN